MTRKPRRVPVVPAATAQYISRISWEYARYTLDFRGIPTFTDALKSSQRIAMHLMRTMSGKMRTAAFSGLMIESGLYTHGDSSASDAVSKMASPYMNNRPFIRGEGAFGTRSAPDMYSAPRYTHVQRSSFAEQVIYVDHEIAPLMENYDGSAMMPATFLPLLPLTLLNGIRGIATGWSTMILPRSLEDIKTATLEYMREGKISGRLFPKYENYDVKVNRGDGPGRFIVTGRFERVDKRRIRITEIPLESHTSFFNMAKYNELLIWLEEHEVITDFINRSKDKIDIEVHLNEPGHVYEYEVRDKSGKIKTKTTVTPEWTDENVLKWFDLQHILSERLVALGPPDDPGVRQFETAHDLVKAFVDWRLGWYRVRYERLERLERDRELFLLCYLAAHEDVVEGLRKLQNKTALKELISKAITRKKLDLREEIVERLAVLPAFRWTREEAASVAEEAKDADAKAREHAAIAKSPARQKRIYESEVEQIRV
jgi:DNA gyrase/topoisomerase IV subunit A